MIKVSFPGPIPSDDLEIDVKNLKELKEILNKNEKIAPWLKESAVFVNDEVARDINLEFKDGDEVVILAPVCGG